MSKNYKPIQTLDDFKDSVTKVKMNQTQIVASCVDGHVRVFDIRMMKMLKFGQFDSINSFDLGIDQNFVAVSSLDSTVRMLDIMDGQIIKEYRDGHTSS